MFVRVQVPPRVQTLLRNEKGFLLLNKIILFSLMAIVYILYSQLIDAYYVGSCKDLSSRFKEHLSKKYPQSFTAQTDDWKIFIQIDELTYLQARNIEEHIKNMKSRSYIENLSKYPEMRLKLINKYS